jgi:preprotein translocase subunit SecG
MRARNLIVIAVALVGGIVLLRRRTREYVEVEFDDGSSLRFESAAEARDLLDDASAILAVTV